MSFKIVKKSKGATAQVKTVITDKRTKEVLHETNVEKQLTLPFEVPEGQVVGVAKFLETMTTSHSFQGYHCSIGIDFPFAMKPGDIEAFREPFVRVQDFCDEILAERLEEAPAILNKLVGLKSKVNK